MELYNVIDWLEDYCGRKVSISHYSNRLIFIQCSEKDVKKDFLLKPDCFCNGHAIKFFD